MQVLWHRFGWRTFFCCRDSHVESTETYWKCPQCHNTYIYRLHYRIHPPNCVSNGHYKTTSLLSHHTQTTKNRLRLLVIISNRSLFKTQKTFYVSKQVLSPSITHIASRISPTDYRLARLCDSINGIVTPQSVIPVKFCSRVLIDNFSGPIGYDYDTIDPTVTNRFNHSSVTSVSRPSSGVF